MKIKKAIVFIAALAICLLAISLMAADFYATRIEYDVSGNPIYVGLAGNPIYVGLAEPGTATTAAYWQITKLTYDGSNNCTAVEYAEGSWAFEYTWSLRATYTYE